MLIPWIMAGIAILVAVVIWQRSRIQIRDMQVTLERQQQESDEKLLQTSRIQNSLLEVSPFAALVVDDDQEIVIANQAARDILGEKVVGQTLMTATRHTDLDALVNETGQTGEAQVRIIELASRLLRARTAPIPGTPFKVLFLNDETELHRLARARREMVANISHELRTPITTIGLLADTLLDTVLKKSKRSRRMVTEIRREVDTLTQLVQEMRDLSLIESGQMPVKMMPIPLTEIVEISIEPLRSLADRKRQQIMIELNPDASVLADRNQIQRVIKNIVHNGIKFAPEDGWIKITATYDEDEATIAISNNGPGIMSEDLPRIFERFYQADRARTDGTGLGLAIARHIVLSHGGRIWAESNTGRGAVFYFTLSLA